MNSEFHSWLIGGVDGGWRYYLPGGRSPTGDVIAGPNFDTIPTNPGVVMAGPHIPGGPIPPRPDAPVEVTLLGGRGQALTPGPGVGGIQTDELGASPGGEHYSDHCPVLIGIRAAWPFVQASPTPPADPTEPGIPIPSGAGGPADGRNSFEHSSTEPTVVVDLLILVIIYVVTVTPNYGRTVLIPLTEFVRRIPHTGQFPNPGDGQRPGVHDSSIPGPGRW